MAYMWCTDVYALHAADGLRTDYSPGCIVRYLQQLLAAHTFPFHKNHSKLTHRCEPPVLYEWCPHARYTRAKAVRAALQPTQHFSSQCAGCSACYSAAGALRHQQGAVCNAMPKALQGQRTIGSQHRVCSMTQLRSSGQAAG